ncbi:response regulator [Cohnella endophytica]|uniref:Response regulator n=1 Tax=Cohnella endophytica TaxID=2419778 RepID=A0A494XKH0_9BACL|nr:response regulator [Cohnella endophytica]RKP48043.1 response regulator [Cohnella endophytica]
MKLYKAIIVDDEKPVLRLMTHVIGMNGRYSVAGTYANPLEALEAVGTLVPDVAFLDIEMPKLSGLELARKIVETSPRTRIVFSTAYRHYALDAFDVNAVDYVLKPVTPAAIARVTARLDELQPAEPEVSVERRERGTSIRCFGAFEARNAKGKLVRWPTRKTEELFAYLLCHPDREIGKWRLADAIWPELDEERAMNNLYNTVYRLKKVLKEQGIEMDVHKTQDGYSLDTGGLAYDLTAFQRSASSDAGMAGHSLEEDICSAYQGKLLETKDYSWKASLAEVYGRQHETAARGLVSRHFTMGEWEQAESRLLAYLVIEPLDERMNRLLFEVYERRGFADKARKHFATFAAAYRTEFGEELTI